MGQSESPLADRSFQQELLATLIRWTFLGIPLQTMIYLVGVIRQPGRHTLLAAIGMPIMIAIGLWSRGRLRRGDITGPTRVYIVAMMALVTRYLLYQDELFRMVGSMAFVLVIMFAAYLEPRRVALRWTFLAAAIYAFATIFHEHFRLPPVPLGPVARIAFLFSPTVLLLVTAIFAQATTRHLHEALARSDADRRQLRQSNRALLQKEADLTALAADLERSNRELQSFAYVVSHDLRAPLRALSNYSRFLQEEHAPVLDESGRQYVQGISESAHHMDALVADLLEYSRIGRIKVALEPVDIGALLERLVGALHLRDRAEVRLPSNAPTLLARSVRLEQVFSNLLDNAVKFQRDGVRPIISVECKDLGEAWEFAVRDNGIGIEAKHFDKIFGIFQRLHTEERYEGTGIGLAIVRKAVEEHGGQVWVESTPGQGSIFRFTLPLAAGAPGPRPGGVAAPPQADSAGLPSASSASPSPSDRRGRCFDRSAGRALFPAPQVCLARTGNAF